MDGECFEQVVSRSLGADGLRLNASDHPILFTEPNRHNTLYREQIVDYAFQTLNVPAVFVAKSASLCAFSAGRTSALIIDIGHSGTTIAPVHEGYTLQRTLRETHLGGALLEEELSDALTSRGYNITPSFAYKRPQLPDGSYATSGPMDALDLSNVDATYMKWAKSAIVRDLKEFCCRVSEQPITADLLEQLTSRSRSAPPEGALLRTEKTVFLLPDGTPVDVAPHARLIPEAFFNPDIIRTSAVAREFPGLSKCVHEVLLASDADSRRDLASGIILAGGSSQFEGMPERLTNELSDSNLLGASLKFRVIAPAASAERKNAAWIGGSILASLGSFQELWVSRAEYAEHGARIVEKKCA